MEADRARPVVLASFALPASYQAAALLLGRAIAERHDLACPSVDAIVTATGASKSHAYEVLRKLDALVPTLVRAPGRPAKEPTPATPTETSDLTRSVLDFVMRHPGCVDRGAEKQRYAECFRRFIVDVRARHAKLDLEAFAAATCIPLGTIKDWLRHPLAPASEPAEATSPATNGETLRIQTVLDAWTRWRGTFEDFCAHVRRDLHVDYGRDLIRRILEAHRLRTTASHKGRSPDELALRGAFRTYFPGAQWVGDGMSVPVVVDGQRFVLNLELHVDAYSGAFVGISIRDNEDSTAVIEAFRDGVTTTAAPPLALLLDNKPSNHCPDVDVALGDTIRIRATPMRPQNKGHVEGAFGLFSQILPALELDTRVGAADIAKCLLRLIVAVWARTTNHRPRKDHDGRSRVDLYSDAPTDEQIQDARRDLRALAEQQERARRTLEARRRPEVLALLDEHFARLDLLDPERHIRIAIAAHPLRSIAHGLFLFEAKQIANTLPDGADARYLLGIVKNVTAKTEGEIFAELLYRGRLEIRDRLLAPLRTERDVLRAEPDVLRMLAACVERAMETPSNLERTFWLDTVVETLRDQQVSDRERLFLHASRLIEACFSVPVPDRHDAVGYVADKLAPLK